MAFVNGSAGVPSISFINDTDTGLYLRTVGDFAATVGGSAVMSWSKQATATTLPLWLTSGTLSKPSLSFTNDQNTGLYRSADGVVTFVSNGSHAASLSNKGIVLPSSNTAGRPASPTSGLVRVNTETLGLDIFIGSSWYSIGSAPSLNNVSLTGIPVAPTAAPGTNTTQIATTEFMTTAIAALPDVTTSVDGFMLATDKVKLDGIATGATANDTDANLKNRANHTGTQLVATLGDASANAKSLLQAANYAAMRPLLSVPKIPGPPEVAIYGDSRAAQMSYNLTNHLTYSATGAAAWANVLSGGNFIFPADLNFGVTGDTTAQILARVGDVVASRAETVVYFGGTNDRNSNELQTAATTIGNILATLNALLAAGKKVILCTDAPRGNATYSVYLLTTQQLRYHQQVRRWTIETAGRIPGVTVVDLYPLLNDYTRTDGALPVVNTYDGAHLSPVGAAIAGAAIADALKKVYPNKFYFGDADNANLYNATDNPRGNLINNGVMSGTAGTLDGASTGSLADSWTSTRDTAMNSGSVTSLFAKVARTNPTGSWQQVTLGGTSGATADPNMEIYTSASNSNFAEGDIVQAFCEMEIDAGATGLRGVTLRTTKTVNAASETSSALLYRDSANPFPSGFTGTNRLVMVTRPFTWGAGSTTSARTRIVISLVESTAINAVIRFGNVRMWKVQ